MSSAPTASGLRVYIVDKKWELFVSTAMSAVGLLTALLINSAIERHRDVQVYRATLSAIQAEADSNEILLQRSFLKYYETGLVLRSFDEGTTSRAIADPLFIKYATPQTRDVVEEYLRIIRLANGFRALEVTLRLSNTQPEALNATVASLRETLDNCSISFRKIKDLR